MSKQDCFYNPLTGNKWQVDETYRLHVARGGAEFTVTGNDVPDTLVRISHLNKGSIVETAATLQVFYDRSPPGREWKWNERLEQWRRTRTWQLNIQEVNHED